MKAPMLVAPLPEAAADTRSSPSSLVQVVLYGTTGLLLFGPLAFGAVEPWSIFVLEAGAALLFALWALSQVFSGELRLSKSPLFLPMAGFAALVAVQLGAGLTAYRDETFSHARLYCSYALLAFLVVQCLRRSSQVKLLAAVISIYGFLLALFALIQGFTSFGRLYWLRVPRSGGWVYGPYVNHNHYAGLMEMLLPIPLIVCLSEQAEDRRRILAGVAAALMAATIFLSGSRGGMLAFVVQLAVLATVLIRRRSGRRIALALGAFLVIGAGVLAWLGGEELANRVATMFQAKTHSELSAALRLKVNRDGLHMFDRKPVLGWGLGTFATVYPQYRSFYTNDFVNQAHDDYLQLLVEMGILGFGVGMWFLSLVYLRAGRKLREWSKDLNGAVALAAILGVTGIVAHSLVDFNLQIPANAALFYVLCTVAAMEPRFTTTSRYFRRRSRSNSSSELSA